MKKHLLFYAYGEVWHRNEKGRWVFDAYYSGEGICAAGVDPLCAAMKQIPDIRLCNRNCRAYFV
jgi:hypothetical protein